MFAGRPSRAIPQLARIHTSYGNTGLATGKGITTTSTGGGQVGRDTRHRVINKPQVQNSRQPLDLEFQLVLSSLKLKSENIRAMSSGPLVERCDSVDDGGECLSLSCVVVVRCGGLGWNFCLGTLWLATHTKISGL